MIDLFFNIDKLPPKDIIPFTRILEFCKFYSIRIYGHDSDYHNDKQLGFGPGLNKTKIKTE